jgi:hypothetical protein
MHLLFRGLYVLINPLLLFSVAIELDVESGMVVCTMVAVEYGRVVSVHVESDVVVCTLVILNMKLKLTVRSTPPFHF